MNTLHLTHRCAVSSMNARLMGLLLALSTLLGLGTSSVQAKPKSSSIDVVPTINSIQIVNGGLVASGTATAVVKGKTYTAPFNNVPVNITLASFQPAAGVCPVLDLTLDPITLNLLGLVVETSAICLQINAVDQGGLLGDLLCSIANLLSVTPGASLGDILPTLNVAQLNTLLSGIRNLLNSVLDQLFDAILDAITDAPGRCDVLNLALGPLDLNLLGLAVSLDDCEGGPVTVDISGQRGGGLLGNLLCGLSGGFPLGLTLSDILDLILSRSAL